MKVNCKSNWYTCGIAVIPRTAIGARTETKKIEIFSIKKVRAYFMVWTNLFGRKNEGIFRRIPHPIAILGIILVCSFCQSALMSASKQKTAMEIDTYSDLKLEAAGELERFQELPEKAGEMNISVILEDAIAIRGVFQKKLQRLTKAVPPGTYKRTHYPFLIYGNQALKGMDFVIAGIKQRDSSLEEKGWSFIVLSKSDVERVTMTDEASIWRPSTNFGFSTSLANANDSTSFTIIGSVSRSISKTIDIGPSLSLMFGENVSTMNLQGFVRRNFINAFENYPEIVPYIGGQIGYNSIDVSGSDTDTTTPIGGQCGILWFFRRNVAINANFSLNHAAGSDSDNLTSFTFSTGLRYTLPGKLKKGSSKP